MKSILLTRQFTALVCIAAVAARLTTAQAIAEEAKPETSLLIEPAELQSRLSDPRLRILDVRSEDDFASGHIPGAVRVDVAAWKTLALSENGLHDKDAWAEKVGALGIRRETPVVVYGGPMPETARVWWTLKYLGVEDAALLNGGWRVWSNENRPVEDTATTVEPVKFEPALQDARLEEIDALKQRIGDEDVAIVDCRSTDEFTGRLALGKRGGHIPGAAHLEWSDLLDNDGRFKPRAELQAMFLERGIVPGKTAVAHCQSGGRATVNAFALELLGYPDVKVYYQSWQEWSADEDAPVEKVE